MCYYLKLGGDWSVGVPFTAPFITKTVQTFHLGQYPMKETLEKIDKEDCLRFGIAGDIGFTRYSTSVQYWANN